MQPCPLAFRLAVDELLAGRLVENQDLVAFDDGDVAGPGVLKAFGMCVLSTDSSLLPDWNLALLSGLRWEFDG